MAHVVTTETFSYTFHSGKVEDRYYDVLAAKDLNHLRKLTALVRKAGNVASPSNGAFLGDGFRKLQWKLDGQQSELRELVVGEGVSMLYSSDEDDDDDDEEGVRPFRPIIVHTHPC